MSLPCRVGPAVSQLRTEDTQTIMLHASGLTDAVVTELIPHATASCVVCLTISLGAI